MVKGVPTDYGPPPTMSGIFAGGKWVSEINGTPKGLSLSVLEDMLQESSPFLRMELLAFPDKVNFGHHTPNLEELTEFIRMHGSGFQTCPNDMSFSALAEYIHQNVASKIKIGSPTDTPTTISCGFSSVFRSGNSCIHGGETSDPTKCIYVHTKSLDPIWCVLPFCRC